MPSIHINDEVWKKVEKGSVKAVIQTKTAITPEIFVHWLIENGLKNIDEIEIDQRAKNPKSYKKTG